MTLILSAAVFLGVNLRYFHVGQKWLYVPEMFYMIASPVPAAVGFVMIFRGLQKRKEVAPFFWNAVTVAFGFLALSINMYPQMIPHLVSPVTIREAAASLRTLLFMLVVTGILIPIMLYYTMYTYRVFRGKVTVQRNGLTRIPGRILPLRRNLRYPLLNHFFGFSMGKVRLAPCHPMTNTSINMKRMRRK